MKTLVVSLLLSSVLFSIPDRELSLSVPGGSLFVTALNSPLRAHMCLSA